MNGRKEEMGNRYQSELDEFHKNFDRFRGKRIVLYGIGRYTATLVDGVKDHAFVGLMDKDPANSGKVMFGLPILTEREAEERADLVIINTSGTYWEVIYRRIKEIRIPVYFLNGELAREEELPETENGYWDSSMEELRRKIETSNIISFDFFDTLFVRKVCNPGDVFAVLEEEIHEEMGLEIPYRELRSTAGKGLRTDYTLKELYQRIGEISGLKQQMLDEIYDREIHLEKRLLTPRIKMLEALKYAKALQKDVYVISDMYLPESFFCDVLKIYQIRMEKGKVLVSCEEGTSKRRGGLWKNYSERAEAKGKRMLHIGDDRTADVEMPSKYGLDSFYVASQMEMLRMSSVREIEPQIRDEGDSLMMGLVLNRLFADPFRFNARKGKVAIQDAEEMGYVVFGPVLHTFLTWVREQARVDGVKKLIFLSRDGYFLKEDYDSLFGTESGYLGISRQLAMTASIQTEEDLWRLIQMPYSGRCAELLEDRFQIRSSPEEQDQSMQDLYQKHREEIWEYVGKVRRDYLDYLKEMQLDNACAVVDLGYYGNNQTYLNELTGLKMRGYYFNANLAKENTNVQRTGQKDGMKACFQDVEDEKGLRSKVLEKMIYLESFLTAPYGMVTAVGKEGNFLCAADGGNQKQFAVKEKINEGVKQFMKDFLTHGGRLAGKNSRQLADCWYGLCMGGKMEFSEEIKKSFYNDNAMMNRIESMLFY